MSVRSSKRTTRNLAITATVSLLAIFNLGDHCGGGISGGGVQRLSASPGLPAFQSLTAVRVPGGLVNAAGANLLVSRTDLSVDTRLGTLLAGATWNGADASWRWSFDLRYDGRAFTDASGARHTVSGIPDGERIPGTVWRRRGPTTLETLGGMVHEFGEGGLLQAMHWASASHPRIEFTSEFIAGSARISRVRQCWRSGECADVLIIAHDGSGRVTSISDRSGRRAEFDHDASGHLVAARDALDSARGWPGHRYEYDETGALTAITNSEGERVEYEWSGASRSLARATRIGAGRVREDRFEREDGHVTRHTDPDGQVFVYDCDSQRRLHRLILPNGESVSWTWQGLDASSRTLPDGTTTTWASESPDQIVRTTPAGNRVVTTFRDDGAENRADPSRRPVARIEDDLGIVERRKYGGGRLVWVENGEGERTRFAYDDENMLSVVTLPSGDKVVLSDFGESGHPGRVARGDEIELRSYDAVGNLIAVTGASWLHGVAGGIVSRGWDEDRNLSTVAVVDADASGTATASGTIAIDHRSDGRPRSLSRPYGADHEFDYDDLARLVARRERVDGAGHTTTFEYDDAGRRVATELPNGMRRVADYDAAGRLVARRRLRYGWIEGEATFAWADGRLTSVHDSVRGQTESYSYDAAGRLSAVEFGDGDRLEIEFDLRSRVTLERYVTPGGVLRAIGRSYDLANREIGVSDGGVPVLVRSRSAGRLAATSYGNGLVQSYSWDDDTGMLASASTADAASVLVATSIERALESGPDADRVRVTAETEYADPGSGAATETFWLGPVDRPGASPEAAAGRRVQAYAAGAVGVSTLAYDLAGNLVARASGDDLSDLTYVYNAERNRLDRVVDDATGATVVAYTWDEAGYATSRGDDAITWDADGRIAALGTDASFVWDMRGRPVRRTEAGAVTIHRFGGRVEADAQGAPARLDLGEVVIDLSGGPRRYRHLDFRGNTQFVSDDSGRIVTRFGYDPYGVAANDGEPEAAATFAGGRATGDVVLLGARVHDPLSARFLAPDPRLQLQNQFAYAEGDPVRFWDPLGLESSPNPALLRARIDLVAGLAEVSLGAASLTLALVTPPPAQEGLLIAGFGFVANGVHRIAIATIEIRRLQPEARRRTRGSHAFVGPMTTPTGRSVVIVPVGACADCRMPGTPPPQGALEPQSGGGVGGIAGGGGSSVTVGASLGLAGLGF